jgi:hypothetical protein
MSKKVSDFMNQFEVVNNIIDYYKSLQAIKRANSCENKVLDYEIKITKVKLENFGINLHDLEYDD